MYDMLDCGGVIRTVETNTVVYLIVLSLSFRIISGVVGAGTIRLLSPLFSAAAIYSPSAALSSFIAVPGYASS